MKIINMKCANCGGKLKKIAPDMLECESCGSRFLIDDETPDYIIVNNYQQTSVPKHPKKQNGWRKRLTTFIVMVFIFMVLLVIGLGTNADKITIYLTSVFEDKLSLEGTSKNLMAPLAKPNSTAGIRLAEEIFKKPLSAITTEELAQVKYISIAPVSINSGWNFSYSLTEWTGQRDYPIETIFIDSSNELALADFTAFKGLNYLDVSDAYGAQEPTATNFLVGLEDLVFYGKAVNQSSSMVAQALPDAGQLQGLKASFYNTQAVNDLSNFPNLRQLEIFYASDEVDMTAFSHLTELTKLSVHAGEQSNFSWLANLTNLEELKLDVYNQVTEFSFLFSLVNLKSLTLSRVEMLKDLSFVKNMPNLAHLSLTSSGIQSLEPLRDKQTLLNLHFDDIPEINDVTALASLTNLTELFIKLEDHTNYASLATLPLLTTVTTDDLGLRMIIDSPTVTTLNLKIWLGVDLNPLPSIPNIEELSISGTSVGLTNEGALGRMGKLTTLILNDTKNDYPPGEEIDLLQLSQLETLILGEGTRVNFNLDAGFNMPNLKYFEIADSMSIDVTSGGIEYDASDVGLDSLGSAIGTFTSLEEIHLVNSKLSSISFAASLPNLRVLDAENNYITDVSPLLSLVELREVNLKNNPVTNLDLLPETVYLEQ
ncbi:leucine-rich repeat domain-containing protein [Enterococcus sp. LJL120]